MTSALDRLITLALQSDDPNLLAAAEAAQAEHNRGRGRPKVKLPSADDPDVVFAVFDALNDRRHTDKMMFWQGVDQFGKPVVDPEWPDGEPVAVTKTREQSVTAIANAVADELGLSRKTVTPLIREIIAKWKPETMPTGEAFSLLSQLELAQKSGKK